MNFMTFHSVGNFIIPTDDSSIISQRGRLKPATRMPYDLRDRLPVNKSLARVNDHNRFPGYHMISPWYHYSILTVPSLHHHCDHKYRKAICARVSGNLQVYTVYLTLWVRITLYYSYVYIYIYIHHSKHTYITFIDIFSIIVLLGGNFEGLFPEKFGPWFSWGGA
jgi:hypothetical protein